MDDLLDDVRRGNTEAPAAYPCLVPWVCTFLVVVGLILAAMGR